VTSRTITLASSGPIPTIAARGREWRCAANLAMSDELGMPVYLESSNRANDHRYERLGFEQVGEFAVPDGSTTLACMWRAPR
jgi:hypothetical protein